MWELPRPGIEPVPPALAIRFLTTGPPGKSFFFKSPFSLKVQMQDTSLHLLFKESGAKSLTPPKVVFNLKIDYLIINI